MNADAPNPPPPVATPAADAPVLPAPLAQAGADFPVVEGARLPAPDGSTRRVWEPNGFKPSYVFLVVVSIASFIADLGSKMWALKRLPEFKDKIELWRGHVAFIGDDGTA